MRKLVICGGWVVCFALVVMPRVAGAQEAESMAGDPGDQFAQSAPMPPLPAAPKAAAAKPKPPAAAEKPAAEPAAPRGAASPELFASLAADRLDSAPNMFGDSYFSQDARIVMSYAAATKTGDAALPLPSADRVSKIAENGNVLPHDRVYFLYNHFDHALDAGTVNLGVPIQRAFDVDRYTAGAEWTFLNDYWSVELRMPFVGQTAFRGDIMTFDDGHAGNLAVIFKRLVYRSDDLAASIGLGIDTPTGSDVTGTTTGATQFTVHNEAVHLMPYGGFLYAPNDRVFCQGFVQVDVAANGDRVDSSDPTHGLSTVYHEQTLLYGDLELGYWLYRNRCGCGLTGLASVIEFHYTGTLQDTDTAEVFNGTSGSAVIGVSPNQTLILNPGNRIDMVNMTLGVHAEFANHTFCRVGGVLPLSTGDNRAFDAELQVQLERRF